MEAPPSFIEDHESLQDHDDSGPSQSNTEEETADQPTESTEEQGRDENGIACRSTESNESNRHGVEAIPAGPSMLADRGSNAALLEDNLGRGQRDKKTPRHLEDYLCYAARSKDPPSSNPLQKVSSEKPYPVANYITCATFSAAHKNFLAAITNIVEPRYFHEALKDVKWTEAMAKEIEALEINKTWIIEDLPPTRNS